MSSLHAADHASSLHAAYHVSAREDYMADQLSEEERIEVAQVYKCTHRLACTQGLRFGLQ